MTMTEDRISELRALCAEYERNKAIDEALWHGDQAADIAADGVGRKALEAMPELLDALEQVTKERDVLLSWACDGGKKWVCGYGRTTKGWLKAVRDHIIRKEKRTSV